MINITYTGIIPYTLLKYANILLENKHDNVIEYCLSFQMIYILSFIRFFGGIRLIEKSV